MQNCHILHFMPFVAGTWSSVEFHFVMCMLMFFSYVSLLCFDQVFVQRVCPR